ncbi:sulfurtransferase complex subunit TusD [Halioxenophilus sp. WMMB6]|uniref:sulfurtransferase complex subunit TusD n=1 Tax=Halioxenophilus sp. WMMB6 TaxID=3073815 RepID=UPI00295E63AF|nr:sulfurtransferase complex subunit TusD [Halioxenophilus sp. WMMB6]
MKFALIVLSPPASVASYSAYNFARAVISSGHQLATVFFYQDGVYNGNELTTPPQDELNLTRLWQSLRDDSPVELTVCIAAGIRRGVLDSAEAVRHHKVAGNLADGFTLGGLGLLVDAANHCDRLVTFG